MSKNFFEIKNKIDILTQEYSLANLKEAASYFKQKGMFSYFIKKISESLCSDWLIPLNDMDYFNPSYNPPPAKVSDNPETFQMPYWEVLGYLDVISRKLGDKPDDKIASTLLNIVDEVIDHRDEENGRIENYHTDWAMLLVLSNLPTDLLTEHHIEFVRESLTSKWDSALVSSDIGKMLLPKLINDGSENLLLQLVDVMLDYKKLKEDRFSEKYTSTMDTFWLADALNKYKPRIAEICGLKAANIAIEKIGEILSKDIESFNNFRILTIEDSDQITSPGRYDYILVQFARDMFEMTKDTKTLALKIQTLLHEKHSIFKRIALHTINKHYGTLQGLFWEYKGNPLEETMLKHEIFELLKGNSRELKEEQLVMVLQWIEAAKHTTLEDIGDNLEKIKSNDALHKKEWLLALCDLNNKKVQEKFDYYNSINKHQVMHPGYNIWHGRSGVVVEESPITKDELFKMPNKEMAEYLNAFKDEGKHDWENLTQSSLTSTVQHLVAEQPKKFSEDLEFFLSVPPIYITRLLWGLREAWVNENDFKWNNILQYIKKLTDSEAFWSDEEDFSKCRSTLVKAITDLIIEGTKSDARAFPPNLLLLAEEILLLLLDKTVSDLRIDMDPFTAALNSTRGSIYAALVNYSLRYARVYRRKEEPRWKEEIKAVFTEKLDKKVEPAPEFSAIIGEYLSNLYWLDKDWVTDKISQIFMIDDDSIHWEYPMSGYLLGSSRVYYELYTLLKEGGQYDRAVDTKINSDFSNEKLIQHICIGYLEGWDLLDARFGLISKVLQKADLDQLQELTSFICSLNRKLLSSDKKEKVVHLWKAIMDVVSTKLNEPEYSSIAHNLSRFLALIDEIDTEVFGWMKELVQYLNENRFGPHIVEDLLIHVDSAPSKVGEIYIAMLSKGNYPSYRKEDIQVLVSKLYEHSSVHADMICNMYGERGYVKILEDVYNKYHKIGAHP